MLLRSKLYFCSSKVGTSQDTESFSNFYRQLLKKKRRRRRTESQILALSAVVTVLCDEVVKIKMISNESNVKVASWVWDNSLFRMSVVATVLQESVELIICKGEPCGCWTVE